MHTLTELVDYINEEFPQESVDLNVFDFQKKSKLLKPQPKFLYRGERTIFWKETKSTLSRNLIGNAHLYEINYWISGINVIAGNLTNDYSLYFFLRDSLFGIGPLEKHDNPEIEMWIVGLLQHYNFDTSFFDFTSDLNMAAFFACYGAKPGDIGQILVVPTKVIEDQYFDLSHELGNRPSAQCSFVLWGTPDLDLKSVSFIV